MRGETGPSGGEQRDRWALPAPPLQLVSTETHILDSGGFLGPNWSCAHYQHQPSFTAQPTANPLTIYLARGRGS